jgi:hypothetical protein
MHRLVEFGALPFHLKAQLFRTLIVVGCVRIGLYCFSPAWVDRAASALIGRAGPTRTEGVAPPRPTISELLWTVRVAGRVVPRAGCLTQVICARALLQRRGLESRMRVGVHRPGGSLEAHAWAETPEGRLLFDPGERSRYVALRSGETA